jgi:hypothetical protein
MYGNESKKWVSGTGRVLLAYVLLFGQSAWAGQDPKAQDKTSATPKLAANQTGEKQSSAAAAAKMQNHEVEGEASENVRADEKSSGDGSHEGIKVHGHWTIEVRNPDGTLATHREFENSYQQGSALPGILSRKSSVGYWEIWLGGSPNICGTGSPGAPCQIYEPGAGLGINTLVESESGYGLVLSGTVTAINPGSLSLVATYLGSCPPTSPASPPCPGINQGYGPVTVTTLSTPIQVSAGQTVAVTVNISFS